MSILRPTYMTRYGYPWRIAAVAELLWRLEHVRVEVIADWACPRRKAWERRGAAFRPTGQQRSRLGHGRRSLSKIRPLLADGRAATPIARPPRLIRLNAPATLTRPGARPKEQTLSTAHATRGVDVVYFAQRHSDGLVKIGHTTDLKRRMQRLRRDECDRAITVIGVRAGGHRLEQWLHRLFAGDRVRGEWFRPSDRVLQAAAGQPVDEHPHAWDFAGPPTRGVASAARVTEQSVRQVEQRTFIRECHRRGMSPEAAAEVVGMEELRLVDEVKVMRELGYFIDAAQLARGDTPPRGQPSRRT